MEPEDFALQRMRACSDFAHRARHELMTPVSGLTMLLSVMRRDDAQMAAMLDEASFGLQRMTRIARACVEYVDAELPLPAVVAVDCNAVFAEAEAAVRSSGEAKFERADIEVRGSLPRVKGHAPALRRVFSALLDNAIRYTTELPAHVAVSASAEGDAWRFEFADRGCGIEAGNLETVFTPFERLHAWDAIQGVGLSLATARRIVERHGGRIGLRARAGGGTIAWLTLPRA
jgi:signal transduction histidine kinase